MFRRRCFIFCRTCCKLKKQVLTSMSNLSDMDYKVKKAISPIQMKRLLLITIDCGAKFAFIYNIAEQIASPHISLKTAFLKKQ